MALWFVLRVNDEVIGHFSATRIWGGTEPDDINVYSYEVVRNVVPVSEQKAYSGQVQHRYGDGALELLRKALNHAMDPHTPGKKEECPS